MLLEERYVDFICEHNITQGQFLLLYLVYKKRLDLVLKYKQKFPTDDGTMIGKRWVEELFDRELLIKKDNKTEIGIKFKEVFCNKIDTAEELLAIYPSTMEINGKIVPLTAIDTITVADLYTPKILDCKKEHEEVLKDIEFAVIHDMINLSLKNFILSKYWVSIRKKRKATTDDTHTSKQANSFG